jgi:hypothetical protein
MTSARRNLAVLRCVDSAGRRGLELLLNALRHTGQHELANMLDNGRRIEPSVEPQQTQRTLETFSLRKTLDPVIGTNITINGCTGCNYLANTFFLK